MNAKREQTDWRSLIEEAGRRVYALAVQTPTIHVCLAKGSTGVYLKLENTQRTGSFKIRGATNKVLTLSDDEVRRGAVASSTGNHGIAVAAAGCFRKMKTDIFVAAQTSRTKLDKIRAYGANIRLAGENPLEAELAARSQAEREGKTYISPYNDVMVVAGQGTVAAELAEQVSDLDAVFVAVGGGGLIAGIGEYLSAVSPRTKIVGCWPENSPVMYECLRASKIVHVAEEYTVSESTGGGIEPGSITLELCRRTIHQKVLVPEQEIIRAMRWAKARGMDIEGSAGLALAAYLQCAEEFRSLRCAVILCGGNSTPEVQRLL